jgi:hypothetical protein
MYAPRSRLSANRYRLGFDNRIALNAWAGRLRRGAPSAHSICVECVSKKNAHAQKHEHRRHHLNHRLAPKGVMPERELRRNSR